MTKFKVSFSIIGLNEIFKDRKQYTDNKILLILQENNQKQAIVTLEANTEREALYKSKSLIQKSLAKLCFAFLDNGSIITNGYSIKDLDTPDKLTKVCKSLTISYNILDKNSKEPDNIISMIQTLNPEKKNVLDLALMYLKIGNYDNPFRLSSLFSSISVITRDKHKDEGKNEDIEFTHMESLVKQIVKENNHEFIKSEFHRAWKSCRMERHSIEHGYPSSLIDINTTEYYDSLANQAHEWANQVIYYFIEKNQQTNLK